METATHPAMRCWMLRKLSLEDEKPSARNGIAANNLLDTRYRHHLNWAGIQSMGRNFVFQLKLGI